MEAKFRLQSAHQKAVEILLKNKKLQEEKSHTNSDPIDFKMNDLVLLEKEPKLKHEPQYSGPYKIVDMNDFNCTLTDETDKKQTVHKNRLKKFHKIFFFRFLCDPDSYEKSF